MAEPELISHNPRDSKVTLSITGALKMTTSGASLSREHTTKVATIRTKTYWPSAIKSILTTKRMHRRDSSAMHRSCRRQGMANQLNLTVATVLNSRQLAAVTAIGDNRLSPLMAVAATAEIFSNKRRKSPHTTLTSLKLLLNTEIQISMASNHSLRTAATGSRLNHAMARHSSANSSRSRKFSSSNSTGSHQHMVFNRQERNTANSHLMEAEMCTVKLPSKPRKPSNNHMQAHSMASPHMAARQVTAALATVNLHMATRPGQLSKHMAVKLMQVIRLTGATSNTVLPRHMAEANNTDNLLLLSSSRLRATLPNQLLTTPAT